MDLPTWSLGRLIAITITYWAVAVLLGGPANNDCPTDGGARGVDSGVDSAR